jgi:hypothetical protein
MIFALPGALVLLMTLWVAFQQELKSSVPVFQLPKQKSESAEVSKVCIERIALNTNLSLAPNKSPISTADHQI